MISGKIILKSATKVSLDKRFTEIAKQAPPTPTPRIQQQANVIIPHSRQELFGNNNRRPAALSIAQRLKKRSINYRLRLDTNANANRLSATPAKTHVFQRLSFGNRRRGRGGNNPGANSYLFGGQSGMGIRLQGQGRIGGTRTFRSRTRGYLNNNAISRFSNFSPRGGNRNMNNNRGRRIGNNNSIKTNNNFIRSNRGRGTKNFSRGGRGGGRGRNNNNNTNKNNTNVSKASLDTDLDKYMAQTKIENDSIDMNAV
ncbi:unnamed protein product [Adineta steineri]|uniref:Chromatin target of PRMT1 protein C-terminal domain-containing protein n=1 Tax=Adineta steineri TaxID=433720 RepID=A0A819XFH4_9BILA|nr:unnamed protein product [Adineta steineri]CAF4140048.1 unnamed protein product [Adineta steineri]